MISLFPVLAFSPSFCLNWEQHFDSELYAQNMHKQIKTKRKREKN